MAKSTKPTFIPAQPGFFVVVIDPSTDALVTEPVIAWDIWPEGEGNDTYNVKPVTAAYCGLEPRGLRYPDGRTWMQVHNGRDFEAGTSDVEIAEYLRKAAQKPKLKTV